MSQQDVQTIREGYDAFNRQDIPGVLERFDPQIEWNEPGGGRAPAGIFHGAQEIAGKVFALVPENFDEFSADAQQFIDAGEHVVVVGRFRGRAKHGAVLDAPFVHVWKMLNGKAARFYHHVEQSAWTKAGGGSYRLALTRMVPIVVPALTARFLNTQNLCHFHHRRARTRARTDRHALPESVRSADQCASGFRVELMNHVGRSSREEPADSFSRRRRPHPKPERFFRPVSQSVVLA